VRNLKKIFLSIILLSSLFLLTGCSTEKEENLNKKAVSEVEYFSSKLINVLNRLNNITFENYLMVAEKTELNEESAEQEKTSSSGSSQNSEEEGNSNGSSTSSGSETGNEEKGGESSIISSQLAPNTILNPQTTEIDWSGIKNEMENLYFAWNTVILDLYKLNVSNDDILGFSSSLDIATNYIKNEDKENSLLAVANLYGYLPIYIEAISDDTVQRNIVLTKSYILNSYAFVGQNAWDDAQNEIAKADETFRMITTDVEYASQNSYKVNKTYVLLNELKNSMSLNDTEIFYIKYRNLLEEINEL